MDEILEKMDPYLSKMVQMNSKILSTVWRIGLCL